MKNDPTPPIPKAMIPIMEAFNADSKKTVNALLKKSMSLLYGDDDFHISKEEVDGIYATIKSANTQDPSEKVRMAKMIVCHLLGIRRLNCTYRHDRKLGLDLLRFGHCLFTNNPGGG